jgi:fructose-bisphosphate aldolase/6-deoxy-5-ketofructose 1-phosphate synthase
MIKFNSKNVPIPADVPAKSKSDYIKNFLTATHNTGNLMLFAGDQKIEHLNQDFYGDNIHNDDGNPEHLFKIASQAKIGAFASQLGLIARYGSDYKTIPYLIKLNSRTNLIPTKQMDPISHQLWDVYDVEEFKQNSKLNIVGVGYTIYLGSEYENEMLTQAAQTIYNAHQLGMIVLLWIYPRGKAITNEKDANLIAGATGTAACLGADFVKVNYPQAQGKKSSTIFKQAISAAGRTGVICSGGESTDPIKFLATLADQISVGARGNATGRNIHQKSLDEAIRMCNAIYAITVQDKNAKEAYKIYKK